MCNPSCPAPEGFFGPRTVVRSRIILLERSDPLQELLRPPLLEEAHERRPQRLAGVRGHLGHRGLEPAALLHVAARDLLKLEVPGHVGGDEDVCQLAVRHE